MFLKVCHNNELVFIRLDTIEVVRTQHQRGSDSYDVLVLTSSAEKFVVSRGLVKEDAEARAQKIVTDVERARRGLGPV